MDGSPAAAAKPPFLSRVRVDLSRRLFAPRDIASLVFFRVTFGLLMVLEAVLFLASGKVRAQYMEPEFYFKYYGFEWVQPWPGDGMIVHFVVLGLCGLGIALGWCYRLSMAVFCLCFTYVFLLDQAHYLNHFYLICLLGLLLVFMPLDRRLSLATLRRPERRRDWIPGWPLWLLRTLLGVVYFYAGVAKLNADWLRGEPLRMWLEGRSQYSWLGDWLAYESLPWLMSYGGLILDLAVVPLLLWRPTRPFAFVAAMGFHVANAMVFGIGIFPWLMMAATTLFLEPEWPRRLLRRRMPAPTPVETRPGPLFSPGRRRVVVCIFVFLLVQVLLPLRHWAYPGNVAWTEEGHRFAWRMKLRSKRGWARFSLADPATGETWFVNPSDLLTDEQAHKMKGVPDMILQFAHELARRERAAGHDEVEVRVRVLTSLNGRRPRLLIDPEVDLVRVRRSLMPASWIEELPADAALWE